MICRRIITLVSVCAICTAVVLPRARLLGSAEHTLGSNDERSHHGSDSFDHLRLTSFLQLSGSNVTWDTARQQVVNAISAVDASTQTSAGLLASLQNSITLASNVLMQLQANTSDVQLSISQDEVVALRSSKKAMQKALDSLGTAQGDIQSQAADLAVQARNYIAKLSKTTADIAAVQRRIDDTDAHRNASEADAGSIALDLGDLQTKLSQTKADTETALKTYKDRQADLSSLVADGENVRGGVDVEVKSLQTSRATLQAQVAALAPTVIALVKRRDVAQNALREAQRALTLLKGRVQADIAVADAAEKRIAAERSDLRLAEDRSAASSGLRRDSDLALYQRRSENDRLTSRRDELQRKSTELRRTLTDLSTATSVALARVERAQRGLESLRAQSATLFQANADLESHIKAAESDSDVVHNALRALNNVTVDSLISSADLRVHLHDLLKEAGNLTAQLRAAEKARARSSAQQRAPGLSDEVLASLGLGDERALPDAEGSLNGLMHLGPSDEDIAVAMKAAADEKSEGSMATSRLSRFRQMERGQQQHQQGVLSGKSNAAAAAAAAAAASKSLEWRWAADILTHDEAKDATAARAALSQLEASTSGGGGGTLPSLRRGGLSDASSYPRFKAFLDAAEAAAAASTSAAAVSRDLGSWMSLSDLNVALASAQTTQASQLAQIDAANNTLVGLNNDISTAQSQLAAAIANAASLSSEKTQLATDILALRDRSQALSDLLAGMDDSLRNSSDAVLAAGDQVADAAFQLKGLQSLEPVAKKRAETAASETDRLEGLRRSLLGDVSAAAEDRINSLRDIKTDIRILVAKRRTLSQGLAKAQADKLEAASNVDALSARLKQLGDQQTALNAEISSLSEQSDATSRVSLQQEALLTNAAVTLKRVQTDLPSVRAQRTEMDALNSRLEAAIKANKDALIMAEANGTSLAAQVDALGRDRTALNAAIADAKIKLSANEGTLLDTMDQTTALQIEVDRLTAKQNRVLSPALTKALTRLADFKAALGRAEGRRVRASHNLADMKRKVDKATDRVNSLRGDLGMPQLPPYILPSLNATSTNGLNGTVAVTKLSSNASSPSSSNSTSSGSIASAANSLGQQLVQRSQDSAALAGVGSATKSATDIWG